MKNVQETVIRIHPLIAIIVSIFFSPVLIAGIGKIFDSFQIPEGIIMCLLYPVIVCWCCVRDVCLSAHELTYRMLFRRITIRLDTVTRVQVIAFPVPTLVLHSHGHSGALSIRLKPYSKKSVTFILHHIKTHSPHARFDNFSSDLETGDFSTISREALRVQNISRLIMSVVGVAVIAGIIRGLHILLLGRH